MEESMTTQERELQSRMDEARNLVASRVLTSQEGRELALLMLRLTETLVLGHAVTEAERKHHP